MEINRICVFGGSGFVGSHIVRQLAAQRFFVRVPSRNRERAKELIVLPTVEVVTADIHDDAELKRLLTGVDAVINLVGILHENKAGRDFARAHVELPRRLLDACRANGVRRFVHMSALNASSDGPSAYLRSKGEGEALVRAAGGPALCTTIFRPSVIFGPGDSFLNLLAGLQKRLPVLPVARPDARFQPVYVGDVARAFAASLADPATYGQIFDLCGPKVYTMKELAELVGRVSGFNRPVVGLTDGLSNLQAWTLEWLPVKIMTRDNLRSMSIDNVCNCPFPPQFGFEPTPLEAVLAGYIADQDPRARYDWFRQRAGR